MLMLNRRMHNSWSKKPEKQINVYVQIKCDLLVQLYEELHTAEHWLRMLCLDHETLLGGSDMLTVMQPEGESISRELILGQLCELTIY